MRFLIVVDDSTQFLDVVSNGTKFRVHLMGREAHCRIDDEIDGYVVELGQVARGERCHYVRKTTKVEQEMETMSTRGNARALNDVTGHDS